MTQRSISMPARMSQTAARVENLHVRQVLARHSNCRPATKSLDGRIASEPAPIWMAALLAIPCQALGNGFVRAVRWDCASGRAVYTNQSAEPELIQPLNVQLEGGDTLAVSWLPGETAYTLEIYSSDARCVA